MKWGILHSINEAGAPQQNAIDTEKFFSGKSFSLLLFSATEANCGSPPFLPHNILGCIPPPSENAFAKSGPKIVFQHADETAIQGPDHPQGRKRNETPCLHSHKWEDDRSGRFQLWPQGRAKDEQKLGEEILSFFVFFGHHGRGFAKNSEVGSCPFRVCERATFTSFRISEARGSHE